MAAHFNGAVRLKNPVRLHAWAGAWLLLAGLLFCSAPARSEAVAAASSTFVMGAGHSADSYTAKWVKLIYTEAFKRLGIPLQIEYLTGKRRGMLADDAGIDGEVGRVYSYAATHPNQIRVEEPVAEISFSLYTANPTLRLRRLDDLYPSSLLVEYRRGIDLCENMLKQLLPAERISEVPTEQQGMKKLLAGRTDLYCDIDLVVTGLLHTPEFKNAGGVRKVIDVGKSVPIYPYLNKKHAELAPRLAATLKKMKAEGVIETYRLDVERELGWAHQ